MNLRDKEARTRLIAIVITLGANLLFFLTRFLTSRYDNISLDQLLYQTQTSISGTDSNFAASAVLQVGGLGGLMTVVCILAYRLLSGDGKWAARWEKYREYCCSKVCAFFRSRALALSVLMLLCSVVVYTARLEVFSYVGNAVTDSDFIEEHYVDPKSVELTFPEEKKNLIYIYLESMENTFADAGICTTVVDNYIPELTQLARENVTFTNNGNMGGAYSYEGTTWTAAALVAQTAGVPVKVSLTDEKYGEDAYMPGITVLGDILAENGYQNVFLMGSNAQFANRDAYFTQHGNYELLDTNALKAAGRLDKDYQQWWGFEDEKLFAYAKEELTRLAATGEPFNFTMLTADSHFPDGYVCPNCQTIYEEQYANVLRCSSRQISAFIDWLRQQPFYEDTVIILSGDHLTMDPKFLEELDEDYDRTIYNCFINAQTEAAETDDREFGTFDMFPSTLAALGVTVEGDRLGLGTNLFSEKPTLTEEYGYTELSEILQKNSAFYNTKFFFDGQETVPEED